MSDLRTELGPPESPPRSAVSGNPAGPLWRYIALSATLSLLALMFPLRYFVQYGRSAVWDADGLSQHYPALYFVNVWVREFLSDPRAGIATWSWDLGLGADVVGTLTWPVLGDPFALLSLLFPLASLEYVYAALLGVRAVAASVASAAYFREMGARVVPAAIGSLLYVWATFLLMQGRHPFFVTAMFFLPLLLIGVERSLRSNRPAFLIVTTAAAAVSNYYFFYVLTIIVALYAAARHVELTDANARWRRLPSSVARVGGPYTVGALLAAPVLVPSLAAVLATDRSAAEFAVPLVYPLWVYASQLYAAAAGVRGAPSTYLGFAYLAWFSAAVVVFRKRENGALRFMLIACAVIVLVPVLGSLLNGFTFPSNRFAFAWGLFMALATALVMSRDEPLNYRDLAIAAAAFVLLAVSFLAIDARIEFAVASPVWIGALTLGVLIAERVVWDTRSHARPRESRLVAMSALVVAVMAGIAVTTASVMDRSYGDSLAEFVGAGAVQRAFDANVGEDAPRPAPDDFFRIDNDLVVNYNSSLVHRFPGTSYYFSTMDGDLTGLRRELELPGGWSSFSIRGLDERVHLSALLGVRYYLTADSARARAAVPWGFQRESVSDKGVTYRSPYALPLAFVYDRTIDRAEFDRLGPVDRQAALLDGAVIEVARAPTVPRTPALRRSIEVTSATVSTRDAHYDRSAGVITRDSDDAVVVLGFEPIDEGELYVVLTGFDNAAHPPGAPEAASGPLALPTDEYRITYRAGDVAKTVLWQSPSSNYYWGARDHIVNLGAQRGEVSTVAIEPELAGTLRFKQLGLVRLPLDDFPARVKRLRETALTDMTVTDDRVRGVADTPRGGVLFLSIPYTTGWRAYVDGRPVETFEANVGFTGLNMPPGHHEVELRYATPGAALGGLIALIGATALLLRAVMLRRADGR